ncbi:hypothetical protein [Streptomyces sp. NPDC056987]|uniref:hypothetical protein n=1 Tax=Streptomyces sp. NPDC056987 TaxID=3345988 RepID=UPI003638FB2F
MAAPKVLALRPAVSTAVAAPSKERPEAGGAVRHRAALSNAAVGAALVGGRGPVPGLPLPGRVPPGAQDMVGNGAVAAAGRGEVGVAPGPPVLQEEAPVASGGGKDLKARPGPEADPKFAALKKDVGRKKRALAASHPPPKTEAVAAQDAARPPKDDEEAQGKTANAEKMNEAQPKEFDKDAFIKAVEKAIADKAPKNLDEADRFAGSGKPEEVQAEVRGQVGQGKAGSAEEIATTTAAPPDTSAAVTKEVVPLAGDRPPGTPGAPDPAGAVPDALPVSATDLSAGPAEVERRMSDAQVTEPQLKKSNEPAFNKALSEKKTAERHSAVAPGQMRKHEAGELRTTSAQARRLGTAAMGAMGAQRVRTGQQVGAGKTGAKSRDEEKRAQVTGLLQGVFDTMKTDVEAILDGLDKLVDTEFTRGEKLARDAFTAEHERKMEEYKDRRYSGVIGKGRWVRDLFAGLPEEANKIFEEARDGYIRRMRQVISDVATTIGTELNRAKRRIAQGRTELRTAVGKLPADLRAIGREAASEFSDKFDELTRSVDDKGTALVDTLATKYSEALKSVDDEIAAEKEKNKGLVDKAVDAVKAVIDTVLELKRLLLAVLAKAAQAVLLILKDPIGFLRNLVNAVGAGLRQFLRNIGTHLQQGIMSWLLGRIAEAGVQLPATFDARGIISMLASLLGLTWQNIRARITRKVPEQAVAAAETGVSLVVQVRKQGVAGMWEDLKSRVGDLRKDLMGKVINYVTPTIVQAGIMWVLSLLNPASAFVRAVKLIIDIVTFIVTQARQIFEFVNAVLDAVIAIARGGSGGVPALIERALARSVPVLLGFLASLLGIGGIAAKVKQIVQALTKPVNRAIDWVIDKIVGLVKKLWAKIRPKPKQSAEGEKDGGKDQDKNDAESAHPTVRVPFDMAGTAHKLTFSSKSGDVDVLMASPEEDLFIKKFSKVHVELDHFRYYMESIQDKEVRTRFEKHILPRLESISRIHVSRFKSIYKTFFPASGPYRRDQADKNKVSRMIDAAQDELRNLKEWAAKTGITDLSAKEIDKTLNDQGEKIWREEYEKKKQKIDSIISRFNYNGHPVEYRGSMSSGWRGEQKGRTHFDPKEFDVDMYVVDPVDFQRVMDLRNPGGAGERRLPKFLKPDAVYLPELLRISLQIRAELAGAFPEVKGIGDSSIILRHKPPGG